MLRRLACLLLSLALMLTVCACAKQKKSEQPVTIGFECDVDVQYGDMNVKGHLTRSSAGTLHMDVTEPKSLNGLSMEWDGSNITLKLHGFSFGVNPDTVPQSGLIKSMLEAFDSTVGSRDSGKVTKDGLLTVGQSASGEFEILSDPDNGNLLSLKIPSAELTATFSNFKATKQE